MPFAKSIQIPTSVSTTLRDVERKVERTFPKFKRTLRGLYTTFRKIFPNSNINLKIQKSTSKEFGLHILHKGICEAENSGGKYSYHVSIQLHKDKLTDQFSMLSKAEVKCTCEAFRYWAAYSDHRSKNLYGNPSGWNKVPAKVRNPRSIPGCCKHLMAYINYLNRSGAIRHG